jgi:hypothetical protein
VLDPPGLGGEIWQYKFLGNAPGLNAKRELTARIAFDTKNGFFSIKIRFIILPRHPLDHW